MKETLARHDKDILLTLCFHYVQLPGFGVSLSRDFRHRWRGIIALYGNRITT